MLNSSLRNANLFSILIFILGLIIGIWALFSMKKSKIRITPDVAKNADLIKTGPYKYIRHPMYSAVLLSSLGMLLSGISISGMVAYMLLIFVLSIKIRYEEKLLSAHFPDYKEYKKMTKKLIPFVY